MIDNSKVLAVFQRDFAPEGEAVTMETRFKELPKWSSLASLMLLVELEELSGVMLSAEDMKNAQTIGEVVTKLEAYRQTV